MNDTSFNFKNLSSNKDKLNKEQAVAEPLEKKKRDIENIGTKALFKIIEIISEINESEVKEIFVFEETNRVINELLIETKKNLSAGDRRQAADYVMDEVFGYGPITPLINDPTVTEIMVNGANNIFVERSGKIIHVNNKFRDDNHVMHTIDKIISPLGRRVDESSPMVDARLPDGSRVNIVIPPLSVKGPIITIRKFSEDPFKLDDLINFGTLNTDMAKFLRASVRGRMNVIVAGGTGSGKTTLLNVISEFIPHTERIVTIEDAAELQLQQEHIVSLETRPPNIEGKGAVEIRDLVINSLRMRPDRIVVGEVRGGEALDMLQAMNTGHDGSLTTVHANSPRDTLARLETMVMMSGMDLPSAAIREQVSAAINLIVFCSRFTDGTRKVSKISEVIGMEGNTITLQDIFIFKHKGFDEGGKVLGNYEPTGLVPTFLEKIKAYGQEIPASIFNGSRGF